MSSVEASFPEFGQVQARFATTLGNALHKIVSGFGQRVSQNRIRLWATCCTKLYATLGWQYNASRHLSKVDQTRPTPLSCASLEKEVGRSDRITFVLRLTRKRSSRLG